MTEQPLPSPGTLDDLRARCRAARRAIPASTRADAEATLVQRLLDIEELHGPVDVAWYLPADGEVDLRDAIDPLRSGGATLWLPVVGEARSMRFVRWTPDTVLVANRFGIPEPVAPDGGRAAAVDGRLAEQLDAVVVPCVAVDPHGARVGFGAGYYDRALGAAPVDRRPRSIGVAFELQVVDELDPEPWDVPLDVVVTEARTMRVEHR